MSFLVIEAAVLGTLSVIASGGLLHFFTKSNFRQIKPAGALLVIFVAFVVTITPICLLVVDISYGTGEVEASPVLTRTWQVLWWATQLLSWVVLPLLQDYCDSGHFTFKGRLWYSFKQNIKLYLILGVILGALLIYVVVVSKLSVNATNCIAVATASSNAFGLLLICLFLGYGLVQVPRWFYFHSTRMNTIRLNRWRAVDLFEKLETKRLEWSELKAFVEQNVQKVQHTANEELINAMQECLQLITSMQMQETHRYSGGLETDGIGDIDVTTITGLVKLHHKCIKTKRSLEATSFQWCSLVRETSELEQFEKICETEEVTQSATSPLARHNIVTIKYNVYFKKALLRTASALSLIISLALLFSYGIAVPFKANLSLVRFLVLSTPSAVQHISVLVLMPYAAGCCYWALFRIKLFDFDLLIPKYSNPVNLCFTATFLCRLIIPLCYCFLNICDLVDSKSNIAYTHAVVRNMNVVNLLGEKFNQYMPCLLLLVAVGTATDLMPKALNSCGMSVFRFGASEGGNDSDRINEGQDLLRRESGAVLDSGRGGGGGGGGGDDVESAASSTARPSRNPLRFARIGRSVNDDDLPDEG